MNKSGLKNNGAVDRISGVDRKNGTIRTVTPVLHRQRARLAAAIAIGAGGLTLPTVAKAQSYWNLPGQSGDFSTASNWVNGVPNGVNAVNGGVNGLNTLPGGTIIFGASATDTNATVFELHAGDDANDTATWIQVADSLTAASSFRLATNASSTGIYNITGGSFVSHGRMLIGENGTGIVLVNGSSTTFTDDSTAATGTSALWAVGAFSGSHGNLQVSNGATLADNASGDIQFQIGAVSGATGSVLLGSSPTDTATINTSGSELWIGNGGSGVMTVQGGTLNVGNWLAVGRSGGRGVLNISGGVINETGTGHFDIGAGGGAVPLSGIVNQTGGTINATNSGTWVGETGPATYNMSGGLLNTVKLNIDEGGGGGVFNLNTGGLVATGEVLRGSATGTGILNFNGGVLQASSGAVNPFIAANLSSVNILAGGANINANGNAILLNAPFLTGTAAGTPDGGLNISGGSTVTMNNFNTYTGPTTINGGTNLQLGNTSAASIAGGGSFNYGTGAFTTAEGTGTGYILGPVSGSGFITISTGTFELGSSANTYTGQVTVSNGAALILGTNGTSGSLSPASTLVINTGGIFGYNHSATTTDTIVGAIPGGGTILENLGAGTISIGAGNNATKLIATAGVIDVTDPTGLASVTSIQSTFGGSVAVPLALENQATLNLFNTSGTGTLALTADTNANFNFSAAPNLRLGAFPAGVTINYSGTITPANNTTVSGTTTTVTSHTLVLGGGGGTINIASPIADGGLTNNVVDTLPTSIDINGGSAQLSSPANTFSGTLTDQPNGTLVVTNTPGIFGDAAAILLRGGVVMYPSGLTNPLDITTQVRSTTSVNGAAGTAIPVQIATGYGATINTNGSSVTFAGPIVGQPSGTSTTTYAGSFTKLGTGTLTDTSTIQSTTFFVRGGTMVMSGNNSSVALNSYVSIGQFAGDSGTLTLDNGTTFTTPNDFNVADNGGTSTATTTTGIVNIQNSAYATNPSTQLTKLTTNTLHIGNGFGGTPFANATVNQGPGTLVTVASTFFVGGNGNGTYNQTGGTLNSVAPLQLAINSSSTGIYTLNGGTLNVPAGIIFGSNVSSAATVSSVGVVNLNGGTLQTTGFTASPYAGASSTVNFNGSNVVLTGTSGRFLGGVTNANLMSGGLLLNTNGNSTSIYTSLNSGTTVGTPDGGITKSGMGVLTIAGTQAYTGVTNITGGTLRLNGATAPIQTGLTAWYDAADTSSLITSGNNVTGVMNKGVAGPGLNATATSTTTYAQLTPMGQNGNNVLTYTGITTPYNSSANDPISGSAPRTEFVVASRGTGASNFAVNQGTVGTTNAAYGVSVETGNTYGYTWNNDLTFGAVPVLTPVIVDTTLSATGTFLSGDLISPTVSTSPIATSKTIAANTTATPLQIIDRPGSTSSGTLDEVLEYNFSMTSTQVSQIENYLEYKWFNVGSASVTSNLLPVTTVVSVTNAGSTFDLGGTNQQVAGLNGTAGTLVLTEAGTLTLSGTAASTYSGNITAGTGGGLTVSVPSFTLGAANTGAINVQTLGTVNISAGSVLAVTPSSNAASRTLIVASSVNVAPTGSLVLGSGDIDINGGTQSLAAVTQLVATGYNLVGGGKWNGVGGITSSSAAADTSHLHALGVIQNNQDGTQLYGAGTTFDGTNPGASDILVKYTYFGDANLDGKVDGSDYSLIDAGYASNGALTGWLNGDFNYDGSIDGSDYALIDNAFNNQGGNLSPDALVATETAQVAGAASPAAVPEPASLGLLAVGAAGLFARRRRQA